MHEHPLHPKKKKLHVQFFSYCKRKIESSLENQKLKFIFTSDFGNVTSRLVYKGEKVE